MNREKLIEFMKSEGYELLGLKEPVVYSKAKKEMRIYFPDIGDVIYFKKIPEPKFPKIFEDAYYEINVENNLININDRNKRRFDFSSYTSLPLLIEAVEYLKEHGQ